MQEKLEKYIPGWWSSSRFFLLPNRPPNHPGAGSIFLPAGSIPSESPSCLFFSEFLLEFFPWVGVILEGSWPHSQLCSASFLPPDPPWTHLWNPVFQSQILSQTSHCQETRVLNPLVRYQVKFQVHCKFKKNKLEKLSISFFDRMRWVLKLTFQLRFKENARKHKLVLLGV